MKKSFKSLFFLSLIALIFSSCSQRFASHYKIDRMDIAQAPAMPENGIEKPDMQYATLDDAADINETHTLAAEVEVAEGEPEVNAPVAKLNKNKKATRKAIMKHLKEVKPTASAKYGLKSWKKPSFSSIPLLAMKSNVKSVEKPMRDYLVLGILLLVLGLVLGIVGGKIFGTVGAILAVIGLVLIILYIVETVV